MPAQDLIGYSVSSDRIGMRAPAGLGGAATELFFRSEVWQQSGGPTMRPAPRKPHLCWCCGVFADTTRIAGVLEADRRWSGGWTVRCRGRRAADEDGMQQTVKRCGNHCGRTNKNPCRTCHRQSEAYATWVSLRAGAAIRDRRPFALLFDFGLGLARQAAARWRFAGRLGGGRGLLGHHYRRCHRSRLRRSGGGRFAFARGGWLGFFRRRRFGGGALGLGRRGVCWRGVGGWRCDRCSVGDDGRLGLHRGVNGGRFDRSLSRRGIAFALLAAAAIAASATRILLGLDRFRLRRHRRRFSDDHGRIDHGDRFGAALGIAFGVALGGAASATATTATRLLLRFGWRCRHVRRLVMMLVVMLPLGRRLARGEGQLVGLDVGDAAVVDRAGIDAAIDAAIGTAFGETLGGAASAATATALAVLAILARIRLRLLFELLARLLGRRVLTCFLTRFLRFGDWHALQRQQRVTVRRQRHQAAATEHVGAGFFIAAEFEQAARFRLFQQIAEGAEAIVGLAEVRLAALDRFLQHRGPDLAAVAALGDQRIEGADGDVDGFAAAAVHVGAALALLFRRALRRGAAFARVALGGGAAAFAHQVVVEDEFVAVGHQQVRC